MDSLFYNGSTYEVETAQVIRMLNSIFKSAVMFSRGARVDFKDSDIDCPEVIDDWLHGMLKRFDRQVDRAAARFQNIKTANLTADDIQFKADFDMDFAVIRLCCEFYPFFLLKSVAAEKRVMRLPGDLLLRLIILYDDGFAGKIHTRGMLSSARALLGKDGYNIADVNLLRAFPA